MLWAQFLVNELLISSKKSNLVFASSTPSDLTIKSSRVGLVSWGQYDWRHVVECVSRWLFHGHEHMVVGKQVVGLIEDVWADDDDDRLSKRWCNMGRWMVDDMAAEVRGRCVMSRLVEDSDWAVYGWADDVAVVRGT